MPVRGEKLRQRLDALVATFDVSTIEPDPLQLVLRYDDPRDQEIAGILAAAFAYGRADVVVANVGSVFDRMAPSPFSVVNFRYRGSDEQNRRILEAVNATGEVFLSSTVLRGKFTLHLAIGNHATRPEHVARAWELVRREARQSEPRQ